MRNSGRFRLAGTRRFAGAVLGPVLAGGLAADEAAAQAATVTLTLGTATVAEADAAATDVVVTARLSAARGGSTTVNLSLDGTANPGNGLHGGRQRCRPSRSRPGKRSGTRPWLSRPWTTHSGEGDETIEVNGTATGGLAVIGASVSLADNDTRPTIRAFTTLIGYLHEGTGTTTVRVIAQLEGSSSTLETETVVTLRIRPGGPIRGTDYTLPSSQLSITIPAGHTSAHTDIDITVIDDAEAEGNERIDFTYTAQDHLGNALEMPHEFRTIATIAESDQPITRTYTTTFEPAVIRESDLSGGRTVLVTLTVTADQPDPLDEVTEFFFLAGETYYDPEGGCANNVWYRPIPPLTNITAVLPAGTASPSGQATMRFSSRREISGQCDFWFAPALAPDFFEYQGPSVTIPVVPDEQPYIVGARLSGGSTFPDHIISLGESFWISFFLSRNVRWEGASVSFRLGGEVRRMDCQSTRGRQLSLPLPGQRWRSRS